MEQQNCTLDLFKTQVNAAVLLFQQLGQNDQQLAYNHVQGIVHGLFEGQDIYDPMFQGISQKPSRSWDDSSIQILLDTGQNEHTETSSCQGIGGGISEVILQIDSLKEKSNTTLRAEQEAGENSIANSFQAAGKDFVSSLALSEVDMAELKTSKSSMVALEQALKHLKEENNILKEKILLFCQKVEGKESHEYQKLLAVIDKPEHMVMSDMLDDLIDQAVSIAQSRETVLPAVPAKKKRGRPPKKRPIETTDDHSMSGLSSDQVLQSRVLRDTVQEAVAAAVLAVEKKGKKRKNPHPQKVASRAKKHSGRPEEKELLSTRQTRSGRRVPVKSYQEPLDHVDEDHETSRPRKVDEPPVEPESVIIIRGGMDDDYIDQDDNDENSIPVFELDNDMEDPDYNPIPEIKKDSTVLDSKGALTSIVPKSLHKKLKDRHGRLHRKVVRHTCKLCKKTFTHGRPFKRHLKNYGPGPVCCRFCRIEFYNGATVMHHRCGAGKPKKGEERSCRVCEKKFTNAKKLTKHLKVEHSLKNAVPNYFCPHCGRGFVKRPSLYLHLKDHAGDKMVCTKCGEFLNTEEEYTEHIKEHTQNANHVCDKCGALFMRKQQYDQHLAAHTKYDCIICNMAFSHKKLLLKHCRTVHKLRVPSDDSKLHQCTDCGKIFQRPGLLELHMRIHTGERPIECNICKMFFRTPKALAKHKQTRTHMMRSGDMPRERVHLCSVCGRSYFRKQALLRHMKYHTDDKPFNCPHCNYSCRENNNLKRHIALHFSVRDFVCEICGAAFHAKKTLEQHRVYKHSEERPFTCEDCPLTFKTPNALKRHLRIHVNVRQHKCPHCQAGFNRLYNLRRHVKQVHHSDTLLPPPNRVKLLDVPEGQEFHKGPAALGLQGKPNQLPRQPRQKKKAGPAVEAPVEVENMELPQPTAQVSQVATVETVYSLPQVYQTDPHSQVNQVILQPVQSNSTVQSYYTTIPDGRIVYHTEEQHQVAAPDQRMLQDQYQSQDMYSAVSNLLHLMHNTDTQATHLLPTNTLGQPTQTHTQL